VPRKLHVVSRKDTGQIGKRASGADAQPIVSPDEKAIGCNITCRDDYKEYKFNINQCESHVKSDLDTISLNVDTRDVTLILL